MDGLCHHRSEWSDPEMVGNTSTVKRQNTSRPDRPTGDLAPHRSGAVRALARNRLKFGLHRTPEHLARHALTHNTATALRASFLHAKRPHALSLTIDRDGGTGYHPLFSCRPIRARADRGMQATLPFPGARPIDVAVEIGGLPIAVIDRAQSARLMIDPARGETPISRRSSLPRPRSSAFDALRQPCPEVHGRRCDPCRRHAAGIRIAVLCRKPLPERVATTDLFTMSPGSSCAAPRSICRRDRCDDRAGGPPQLSLYPRLRSAATNGYFSADRSLRSSRASTPRGPTSFGSDGSPARAGCDAQRRHLHGSEHQDPGGC